MRLLDLEGVNTMVLEDGGCGLGDGVGIGGGVGLGDGEGVGGSGFPEQII